MSRIQRPSELSTMPTRSSNKHQAEDRRRQEGVSIRSSNKQQAEDRRRQEYQKEAGANLNKTQLIRPQTQAYIFQENQVSVAFP